MFRVKNGKSTKKTNNIERMIIFRGDRERSINYFLKVILVDEMNT